MRIYLIEELIKDLLEYLTKEYPEQRITSTTCNILLNRVHIQFQCEVTRIQHILHDIEKPPKITSIPTRNFIVVSREHDLLHSMMMHTNLSIRVCKDALTFLTNTFLRGITIQTDHAIYLESMGTIRIVGPDNYEIELEDKALKTKFQSM